MELNRLNLNKLNTFVAVVENRGITPAAKKLLLTRSAISQSVTSLEKALGISLFHRIGKKLVLTNSGENLYSNVRSYQNQLQRTFHQLLTEETEMQGSVRVASGMDCSQVLFTQIVSKFLIAHPKANLRLQLLSQAALTTQLMEDHIDFAISNYPLKWENSTITSTELVGEELLLVATPANYRECSFLSEIEKIPLIEYYESPLMFDLWSRHHFGREPVGLNIRACAGTAHFMLELVLLGLGMAVLPRRVVENHLQQGTLLQFRTKTQPLFNHLWLNELSHRTRSTVAQEFRKELIALMNSLP